MGILIACNFIKGNYYTDKHECTLYIVISYIVIYKFKFQVYKIIKLFNDWTYCIVFSNTQFLAGIMQKHT